MAAATRIGPRDDRAPRPPRRTRPRAAAPDVPLVFLSYSSREPEWRLGVETMLEPLVRNQRVEVWADEYIEDGGDWRRSIDAAVRRASLAVLLVSPDFLSSRFIMEQELPALRESGVPLLCVLVRECLWREEPALEKLQWVFGPREGLALASDGADVRDRHAELTRIGERIALRLPRVEPPAREPEPRSTEPVDVAALVEGDAAGRLSRVPSRPPGYVSRDEIEPLRQALLTQDHVAVGVTGDAHALGLHGQGGIGKSVLAAELGRDERIRRHFPDGVYWVSLGEEADVVAAQVDLLERLGEPHPGLLVPSDGTDALQGVLRDRRCLVIVDDVWTAADADALLATGPRGRTLFTSRDPDLLAAVGARVERVEVLPVPAARRLLAGLAGAREEELPPEVAKVLAATNGIALALALVGAAVGRGGRTWAEVADQLERGGQTFLDHPYANTFKSMTVGVAALGDDLGELYLRLAIFPEDTTIPPEPVALLWRRPAHDCREHLQELAERELLTFDGERFAFHDLQRDFLLLHAGRDARRFHADLLHAYRARLPDPAAPWSELPRDEPYIWNRLLYHLRSAGDHEGVARTVKDLAYLVLRVSAAGRHAAESALRIAAELRPHDGEIDWLLRLFTQWGHVLTRQEPLGSLAATVQSRAGAAPAGVRTEGLAKLLPDSYLRPRWPLPPAPVALVRVMAVAGADVFEIAFSPDGERIAVPVGGAVHVLDLSSGALAAEIAIPFFVTAVAWAPEGRLIGTGDPEGAVRAWDTETAAADGAPLRARSAVRVLAFSGDARLVAAGHREGVDLFDRVSGRSLATLRRRRVPFRRDWERDVRQILFVADDRKLAVVFADGHARLLDVATGRAGGWLRRSRLIGRRLEIAASAASDDGTRLHTFGYDGALRQWDAASGRHIPGPGEQARFRIGMPVSINAHVLAGTSRAGFALHDVATGRLVASVDVPGDWIDQLKSSPDGRTVVTGGFHGTLRMWDVDAAATADVAGGAWGANVSVDGRLAMTQDGTQATVWDLRDGRHVASGRLPEAFWRGALAPDGRTVAHVGRRHLQLWDLEAGQSTSAIRARGLGAPFFSPDGERLGAAGSGLRIWDVASRRGLCHVRPGGAAVRQGAFSPDGRKIVYTVSQELVVADADEPMNAEISVVGFVDAFAFSPDSAMLAVALGSDVEIVRLADADRRKLPGASKATALVFSPDQTLLATSSDDEVQILSVEDGSLVARLRVGISIEALVWHREGMTGVTPQGLVGLELVGGA